MLSELKLLKTVKNENGKYEKKGYAQKQTNTKTPKVGFEPTTLESECSTD